MVKKEKKEAKEVTNSPVKLEESKSLLGTIPITKEQEASSRFHWLFNFYTLMICGIVMRFGFIFLNETFNIKTDVDYHVYTEGAQEMLKPRGNPYNRFTYRYTPLLAYMMIPNLTIPFFGKILFNVLDLFAIVYMDMFLKRFKTIDTLTRYKALAFWALNPLMVFINGRGSCESVSLLFLTGMLYHLELSRERVAEFTNVLIAAVYYGLLVHFRLYPVIYGLTIYLWINREKVIPSLYTIMFGLVSVGLNIVLILAFYAKFGQLFLDECFLYHLKRKDPRHNYSIFWLTTVYDYFIPESDLPFPLLGKALLFGRLFLIALVAIAFWKRKILAMMIQTFIFTTFNTVYTGQYAIWEIQLMPYVLADSKCYDKNKKIGFWLILVIWVVNLQGWSMISDRFEHQGENSQYWMHFVNLSYFLIRVVFIHYVVENNKNQVEM